MTVTVQRADMSHLDRIMPLRLALWPDSGPDDLAEQAASWAVDDPAFLLLIALTPGGEAAGFAEASIRTDYVEGCDNSPVAFVEGLFVAPGHRRNGIARALVTAARIWGQSRGATEFASNALLDNVESHAFHRAIGFEETERVVYFRMAEEAP